MAWSAIFIQDTEVDGVGTMRAEYADDTGQIIATYEQRIKSDDESQAGKFIEAAQSVLQKAQAELANYAKSQTLANLLANKLNG